MTETKMDVGQDQRLKGKTNFITWKREFERAAKSQDVLELLTGHEEIPSKPKTQDYLTLAPRSSSRIAAKQVVTPGNDDGSTENDATGIAENTLRWQMDYKAWETSKAHLRIASKLLDDWVCEGIKIEIEDCKNAKVAYDLIKKRYNVSPERARDLLLTQLADTKLDDFGSVTEYLNKLRQIKVDLKASSYVMTDDMFASVLLHGLPPVYRQFKEQYDWIRASKPDDPPDLDFLCDRLQIEEMKQARVKEEKKIREKVRKDNNNSSNDSRGNGLDTNRPKREDKSHLKCDACGKTGHLQDTCWRAHPELMPRALKEKLNLKDNDKGKAEGMSALAAADVDMFKETLARVSHLNA